ncbi:hypothetical protein BDQ17DRAFT_1407266 [Cyathus striatus]|nr:hypothetical protein BDQ17DRAFT_1407266 [Cyathus striatus]
MPQFVHTQGVTTNGGEFNDVGKDQINQSKNDGRTSGHNYVGQTDYTEKKENYSGRFNGGNFGGNGKGGNGYMGVNENSSKNTRARREEEEDSADDSGEEEMLMEQIRKAKEAIKKKEKDERKEKLRAELEALQGKK